jgi:2'-5' RNA ligase
VPAAEPVVASWRAGYDRSAADGIPAHVTVLYPFLREERLSDEVIARLAGLCAETPVLDVEFRRTRRLPSVLQLEPEPADALRGLTAAVFARWPDAPPYGGGIDEVVPHLTVASGPPDDVIDEIEADVLSRLPIRTQLREAALYVAGRPRWRLRARLPFRVS